MAYTSTDDEISNTTKNWTFTKFARLCWSQLRVYVKNSVAVISNVPGTAVQGLTLLLALCFATTGEFSPVTESRGPFLLSVGHGTCFATLYLYSLGIHNYRKTSLSKL